MKSILIIQEGGGHGEVLGAFFDAFPTMNDNVAITVICGNSYGIFGLYDELGFEFIAYNRENKDHIRKVVGLIQDKCFDLIIFNSAPVWSNTEFSQSMLKRSSANVVVLHHSNLKNELEHPFFKLGTSALLSKQVDHVFTPYFDVSTRLNYYKDVGDQLNHRGLGYLGTHYPAALQMRDMEKLNSLFSTYAESDKSNFHLNWYVAHYSDALREAFGDLDIFKVGMSHLEIYREVLPMQFFWGTHYKKNTRYERDGMTGTIPFAVNGAMPVIGTKSFLEIYGFSSSYIDVASRLNDSPFEIRDLDDEAYNMLVSNVVALRDNQISKNRSLASSLM